MTVPEAKEYLFHHITALRLAEKQYRTLEEETALWESRIASARSKGLPDLAREAEGELRRVGEKRDALGLEIETLKGQVERMRKELPALAAQIAAQERRIDPDLLEQELLVTLGRDPGDTAAAIDRAARDAEVSAALAELKAKLGSAP
jgi:phage shock protein A